MSDIRKEGEEQVPATSERPMSDADRALEFARQAAVLAREAREEFIERARRVVA